MPNGASTINAGVRISVPNITKEIAGTKDTLIFSVLEKININMVDETKVDQIDCSTKYDTCQNNGNVATDKTASNPVTLPNLGEIL